MEKQEMWKERIAECESSELSITAWCKENDINKNSLNYWRQRFKQEAKQTVFVEVAKISPLVQNIELEIGDITIKVNRDTDMELLKNILITVASC